MASAAARQIEGGWREDGDAINARRRAAESPGHESECSVRVTDGPTLRLSRFTRVGEPFHFREVFPSSPRVGDLLDVAFKTGRALPTQHRDGRKSSGQQISASSVSIRSGFLLRNILDL